MNLLLNTLQIAGSLALFIYGMKVMSDGIQKAAGGQLRKTLRKVTKRPINGIIVGLLTTGIVQSSSATTVMTISFVNAGLITTFQSVGIIMGANIGTTITAWLVSLGGFLFKLSTLTLPLLTLAVPLYLRGGKTNKYWAEFLIGFCLLFIGLDFLKASLPSFENQEVFNFVKNYTSLGFASRILFVIIGLILTIVVQSSSAAMTLTIALVFNDLLPLDLGCAMIIGENIGTTITAEIAALVGNIYARMSATTHTLFNVIGASWMIFLLGPTLDVLEGGFSLFTDSSTPFTNPRYATLGLAAFHTSFNVLNTLLLIPLIGWLVKIAGTVRQQKSKSDTRTKLRYMDGSITTPELSAVEIQSELISIIDTIHQMILDSQIMLNSVDQDEQLKIHKKLRKQDKKNTELNRSMNKFVIKVAREEITERTSDDLRRYLSIGGALNRISNLCVNISYELKDKSEQKLWFTPDQRKGLNKLYDKLIDGSTRINGTDEDGAFRSIDLEKAASLEKKINSLRDKYRASIKETADNFDFNIDGSLIYFRILTLQEKIGDKLFEIASIMCDE